jgi:tetratricopeptide (TPR) repeat protein
MHLGKLILASGLLAIATILVPPFLGQHPAPPPNQNVADLFNPQAMAANLCRGSGATDNPFSGTRRAMSRFSAVAATTDTGSLPKLYAGMGNVEMAVTTDDPAAQAYFNQGLLFLYGFNHPQAVLAFRAAQSIDPDCAMCYWGEALAWGPNINAPMAEWSNVMALQAIGNAQATTAGSSGKEKALINALATRYSNAPDADRSTLDQAFASAMSQVADDYPDDLNIAVMQAEALMDTQPWDYWGADMTTPKPATAKTLAALDRVLKADPNHMGAIHLYIHITEASTNAAWAEPFADRLAAQAPASGHLVHMPSHTYYRIGRYIDSLQANIDAARADEVLIASAGPAPDWDNYAQSYYPHNVHFLMTSAHMAGDAKNTLEAAAKLDALVPEEVLVSVAWTNPIKAAPYFAYLHYNDSDEVLALPAPSDNQPYVKAAWHFARGSVLARQGNVAGTRAEMVGISVIRANANLDFLEGAGIPAGKVLAIEEILLKGHVARAQGYLDIAIAFYTEAMRLEISLPYTEPPYWYYPVRQTLGAALVQAGRFDEAVQVFTTSLMRIPNNGWALYGLSQAQRGLGDEKAALQTEALLDEAWAGDRATLSLGNL